MLRFLTAAALVAFGLAPVAVGRADGDRFSRGVSREEFEKRIKPFVERIGKARPVRLYEGLPHPRFDPDLVEKELATKATIKLFDHPFYKEEIPLKEGDGKKLSETCATAKSHKPSGLLAKRCGGYHPDWCVEWKDGDSVYRALICFGCEEVILSWPKGAYHCDMEHGAIEKVEAILKPYQKNRPTKKGRP